jgi:hypothetical protein
MAGEAVSRAHFKPGQPYQYRILCGAVNGQGCRNCRGELGRLLLTNESGYLFATPLVSATYAPDQQGMYRMARMRRAFVSGIDGGRNIGAGVTGAHLLHDAQGQPLKMLPPLYQADGHDRIVMACPRCSLANEVNMNDLVQYIERSTASQ